MASIQKRRCKDGSYSFRVQIRRKGLKSISMTFSSLKEAEFYIKEYEEKLCINPELYNTSEKERLFLHRLTEFKRKNKFIPE